MKVDQVIKFMLQGNLKKKRAKYKNKSMRCATMSSSVLMIKNLIRNLTLARDEQESREKYVIPSPLKNSRLWIENCQGKYDVYDLKKPRLQVSTD